MPGRVITQKSFKRLPIIVFAIFLFFSLMSALVLYLSLHESLSPHYGAAHSIVTQVKDSLVTKTIAINLIFYLLIAIGLIVLGILYSHRIAGPLFRVKQYAAMLAEGRFDERIRFRKKDAIHALASLLNEMAKGCEDRAKLFASELRGLEEGLLLLDSFADNAKEKDELITKLRKLDTKIRVHDQKIKL